MLYNKTAFLILVLSLSSAGESALAQAEGQLTAKQICYQNAEEFKGILNSSKCKWGWNQVPAPEPINSPCEKGGECKYCSGTIDCDLAMDKQNNWHLPMEAVACLQQAKTCGELEKDCIETMVTREMRACKAMSDKMEQPPKDTKAPPSTLSHLMEAP